MDSFQQGFTNLSQTIKCVLWKIIGLYDKLTRPLGRIDATYIHLGSET